MKRIQTSLNVGLGCLALISILLSGCASNLASGMKTIDPTPSFATYDWPQFNGDAAHSGENRLELLINPGNVHLLKQLYQASLPAVADGAPAILTGVNTPGGITDLVFLTTKNGSLVALDALSGTQVWIKTHGPGSCTVNNGGSPCYTTSSPATDPNRQYVYSYGLDGKVHKHQVGNGTEVTGGGWPELVTNKGINEKGSSSLSVLSMGGTSYLYSAHGGYPGDQGDYQGHITAINLATGSQKVFNMLCSNQAVHFVETPGIPDCPDVQSAVWSRAPVIFDAANNKIYLATGNGNFNPGGHEWGDSVLALNPDGSGLNGSPLDSYTPTNFASLQNFDTDLGSTAPAILPAPSSSRVKNLAVQSGKDALLRLINLDNLSGKSGPGNTGGEVGGVISVPQGGEVLTQPAVWVNPADNSTWVFIGNGNGISGLKLVFDNLGNPSLVAQWTKNSTAAGSSTSPIIAGGVLFYAGSSGVHALNPTNGASLWSSSGIGGIHWESLVVAGGILYITDESSQLTAFSLNGVLPQAFGKVIYLPVAR